MNCPKCNSDQFAQNATLHGLVELTKDQNGKITVNPMNVFPVQPFFCLSCKHVELKYANDL